MEYKASLVLTVPYCKASLALQSLDIRNLNLLAVRSAWE
jgi:hypothetical protein